VPGINGENFMAHGPSFLFWICAHPRATVCDTGNSDDDFLLLCMYGMSIRAPGDDWELSLTMGAKDS
jgi:hypothetical protein